MDWLDLGARLSDLLSANRSVYIRLEPEAPDFTSKQPFTLCLYGADKGLAIATQYDDVLMLGELLAATVFDPEYVDRVYAWNFKPLASYFHFAHKAKFGADDAKFLRPNNLFDLKPIERFLGVVKNRPENFPEAVNRLKAALQNKSWQAAYKAVHLPLSLRVLPAIESTGLLNEATRRYEYPYYEIEGQTTGRMNCEGRFKAGYLPHILGPELRANLKPPGEKARFLCADFRYCEVVALQWLSGDEKLLEIILSGADLHARIYEIITNTACDTDEKRQRSKRMFLPVMYGMGVKSLAGFLKMPEPVAEQIIARVKASFPTAWAWMQSQQDAAKRGEFKDKLGRPRTFEEPYQARGLSVQAVAAMFCQERLVALFDALDMNKARLAYSVHDGYGLYVDVPAARETYRLVKDTLEAESNICSGLRMKVEIKFGSKLDSMKVLWKD